MNEIAAADVARLVDSDEPVFGDPDGPRFGQDVWDLGAVRTSTAMADRYLNLSSIAPGWRESVREVLFALANPAHDAVIQRGLIRKARPATPRTLLGHAIQFRTVGHWAVERGAPTPAEFTPAMALPFLDDLRSGDHGGGSRPVGAGTQATYARTIRLLWDLRPVLTVPLPVDPWQGLSGNAVAGYASPQENRTPPLPWSVWAAAVRGAWHVVDTLGDLFLAAVAARNTLRPVSAGRCGAAAVDLVTDYLRAGGAIPVHTGVGRRPAPRGEPNFTLFGRLIGVHPAVFNSGSKGFKPALHQMVSEAAADPSTAVFGGVHVPVDERNGASWEFGLGEIEHLESVLRGAAYLLLVALTGMRDSEVQELMMGCRTEAPEGIPGIHSVQTKGAPGGRADRIWFAPMPVFRVVDVLERLTPHSRLLFARSPKGGVYNPTRDIARLVAFVNASPVERVGRGPDLDLPRIDPAATLTQQTMRRSFAVYAARYPGAELGLGIQLGHAALRMTAGYFLDSQQQVARLVDDDRRAVADQLVRDVTTSSSPAVGGGADRLRSFRASVVTSDKRADRLVSQLGADYHLGSLNDCHYVPEHAVCGDDGPHLAERLCGTHACGNAVMTDRHAPAWEAHLTRLDRQLDRGELHPVLEGRLRDERSTIVSILRSTRRVST